MNQVTFVPKHVAEHMQPRFKDTLLISIGSPEDELAKIEHWYNHVRFSFNDVEHNIGEYKMFDVELALALIQDVNESDGDIVVHCEAGMSRSAAVAKWLSDRYDYSLWLHPQGIGTTSHYNRHVYRCLEAATGNDMASYYEMLEMNDRLCGQ